MEQLRGFSLIDLVRSVEMQFVLPRPTEHIFTMRICRHLPTAQDSAPPSSLAK
jgi:hypothetical protein